MALLSNNLIQEILDVANSYADKETARLDRLVAEKAEAEASDQCAGKPRRRKPVRRTESGA